MAKALIFRAFFISLCDAVSKNTCELTMAQSLSLKLRPTEKNGVKLTFIEKGKPHQNVYIERFNRTYRQEILDAYAFDNLKQARLLTLASMRIYNNERTHSSLG